MTITTPIYRGPKLAAIAGMDLSIEPIYTDLSSMKGRSYPFIINKRPDNQPAAVRPEAAIKAIFEADNLNEAASSDVRALAKGMLKGSSGSIVVGLGDTDGYVACSSTTSPAGPWASLPCRGHEPARAIHRLRDQSCRQEHDSRLDHASRRVRDFALITLRLTRIQRTCCRILAESQGR